MRSAQPAIADHALIGDTRTAALVTPQGEIDWMCIPRFDGEPVFGRLIDLEHGGRFAITPMDIRHTQRAYVAGSATLKTSWHTDQGEAVLTDAMIVDVTRDLMPTSVLVRQLRCTKGHVDAAAEYMPRLGLPGRPGRLTARSDAVLCEWGSLAVSLQSLPNLPLLRDGRAWLSLDQGDAVTFMMTVADREPVVFLSPDRAESLVDDSTRWWQSWIADLGGGALGEQVIRSLITLRLLTYSPSSAPVAAPTTSLPEHVGGARNWDYRYSWPRDAAIGLSAFVGLGNVEAAHAYMHWLLHATRLTRPKIRVVYTVDGNPAPKEREIPEVRGFRGSSPVRIGNGARKQHQLDVYGWVVDAASLLAKERHTLHGETWRAMATAVDFVARAWRRPDAGIWEVRGESRHYVHSKLMAWLALDRGLGLASRHGARRSRIAVWRKQRDLVASEVREEGIDNKRGCYVWRYGDSRCDAALLTLPVLEFEPPDSPRVAATIGAIRAELEAVPGLLYRYVPGADDLPDPEGAFLPCSFWLVQALARIGELEEAQELFERVSAYSNDVGLFAEEIEPLTKQQLGNFPQALTHATVVQAARALTAAQEKRAGT